jgi:hypothetical protein
MTAYIADWSSLGTGERPWTPVEGDIVDVLDVADLDSEDVHAYELLGAHDREQTVRDGTAPDGTRVVDGGRTNRALERFVLALRPGREARCVVRLATREGTHVRVLANGRPAGSFDADADDDWIERTFDVPAEVASPRTSIEVRAAGGDIETYHYWCACAA